MRSDRVPVSRDGNSTAYNPTGEVSCSGMMSREKIAPLLKGVGHRSHHRYGALDDEEKETKNTAR